MRWLRKIARVNSMRLVPVARRFVGALVPLLFVMTGVGCGAGSADHEVHRVPGYEASVALPPSWDAVDYQSSAEDLDRFEREHPRFLEIADILRSLDAHRLAAAEKGGDVRLLVSIREAAPGYTLRGHIRTNLPQLEMGGELEIEIHGPHEEIVEVGGNEAWRTRWSYKGDLGRIQLVQYTFVRDGYVYLFTYSTLKRWEESADTFAASARSIRIGSPQGPEPSKEAGLIAFEGEREGEKSDIYVVSAAGGRERRLTRTGKDASPSWSPDGKLIAFTSVRDGNPEIYVMQADGSGQRRLTRDPAPDAGPAWSPDGGRIMFTRGRCDEDACDLYVMNADGSGIERVTGEGEDSDGSWSPDGEQIVFWSGRDFGSGIFVMNVDGSGVRALTPQFEVAWGADWSPDGETILFVGSKDESGAGDDVPSIYRMNADGSDAKKIASATGYWIDEPEWSPDGDAITFFSDGQGPGAIWFMKADGTQQRPLTRRGDSHSPSWQPSS